MWAGSLDHANHLASQENEKAQTITDISGRKCLDLSERSGLIGSWAKMFMGLLIGTGEWYSTRCSLTWKLSATKSNRLYFQLVPSTLPTEETEFGLLPTPRACESIERRNLKTVVDKVENGGDVTLTTLARYDREMGTRLLPTPTAMDSTGATANMKSSQVKEGSMHSMTLSRLLLPTPREACARGNSSNDRGKGNLEDAVAKLLPTPATRDYKGARSKEALENAGRNETNSLPDAFAQTGKTSQLNPLFVGEMMGFPPDWTVLPFQNGETNQ